MHHTLHEQVPMHINVSLDNMWFKLQSIELVRDGRIEQQLIESYVLIIVKSGVGCLTIDLDEYPLRQDAIHIALPGQTLGVTLQDEDELELYVIKFEVCWDSVSHPTFQLVGEIPIYPKAQTVLLCDMMYSYCRSEQSVERFRGQSAFLELLYWIIKNIRMLPELDSRTALESTKAYIESHYNESITIEQLARMAKISPKYYVDLFKKTYGKSAMDYVTEVRVNYAKQFMVQSDARLRDIAHQVGYNDEFYFSRKFKKEVGVSPTAYMKNRRRKIVAYSSPILGQLLALKMIPYAAPLHPKWTAYYHKMYRTDIPLHLSAYRFNEDWESNIEALIQAEPDVVISSDELLAVEKEKLRLVAPIFYISAQDKNWREQLQLTGQLLGASQEADTWLLNYDRKVTHARGRLLQELKDDTILIMSIFKQSYHLAPARGMRDVLFQDLQLQSPVGVDPTVCNQSISLEQLAAFDVDRILLNVCQEPESLDHWQSLQTSSLWQNLKAVRRNCVYMISSDPWREYSAYAIGRMVDDLLKLVYGHRTN